MFDKIFEFEKELAAFTGAPFAIMTDCCTHAIELCLRYERVKECSFTPYTYLSVPMLMKKLDIPLWYINESEQTWRGEYPFEGTRIWDSARRLEPNMYRPNSMQCLSFGYTKPLQIGRGGAILLDDPEAYAKIIRMRYDGRDLNILPWQQQKTFEIGYHYRPTPEEAMCGLTLLNKYKNNPESPKFVAYPDLRQITILEPYDR